jgi:hypothetical protein
MIARNVSWTGRRFERETKRECAKLPFVSAIFRAGLIDEQALLSMQPIEQIRADAAHRSVMAPVRVSIGAFVLHSARASLVYAEC